MDETSVSTALLLVVSILLILDIIIAILILKIVFSIRRFTRLIDALVDDIEKFSFMIKKIKFPKSLAEIIKRTARILPSNDNQKSDK